MSFVAYFLIKESVWMTVPQTFHSTVAFLVRIQVPIHTLPGLHRLDCNGMFAAMRALIPEFNGRYCVFHAIKGSNRHFPPRSPLEMPSSAIRRCRLHLPYHMPGFPFPYSFSWQDQHLFVVLVHSPTLPGPSLGLLTKGSISRPNSRPRPKGKVVENILHPQMDRGRPHVACRHAPEFLRAACARSRGPRSCLLPRYS